MFRYTKSSKKVNIAVLKGKYLSDETIQSDKAVFRVPERNYIISSIIGESVDTDGKTLELTLDNYGTQYQSTHFVRDLP